MTQEELWFCRGTPLGFLERRDEIDWFYWLTRVLRGEMLEVKPVVIARRWSRFYWRGEATILVGLEIQWKHSHWLLGQRSAPWVTCEDEF